ncbi:aminopeptidase P family protein [Chroococcus sp. FPU101]|uniref:aminopeptidase P family protein n=1 Tax=Chroococcus sp. FPU101 TaxID=1974212 RepID=UPI001A8FEFAD|nr:aminopeptidase P family protein [Chroococcus sp. FPU101]GFE68823.1 Xaa-Pro dipeptidase [Chroococcus sp. FPU101]
MKEILQQRRQKLAKLFPNPAILWSGGASSRNFPSNRYSFRASSHFLYFAGIPLENSAIRLEQGKLELFIDDPHPDSTLWHGATPNRREIAAQMGADADYPLSELIKYTKDAATISVQDPKTYDQQCQHLNRFLTFEGIDLELAQAIVKLRLAHDAAALYELKKAASVAIKAHLAGIKTTAKAKTEAEVRAAMESVITAHNMTCAYQSIVTVHGEILHNEQYHHSLKLDDLLLADVGAETAKGWASDITRTWPVSGQFSPTQRDIYDVVLAAHDACLAKMRPDVEYREIHLLAAKVIAEGLVSLGILRGDSDNLVEMDAHALFFPHGIGHLLGLDVHDMEDLGDLAGYKDGRIRSNRFGLGYLRLDRPLRSQMLVTLEPGFYQVPAILRNPDNRVKYQSVVNWDRLSQFEDVRGIRIEDDVLITEDGIEVLTAALPTQAAHLEELMRD